MVSAYRVGKRSGLPGSSTAWYQQKVLSIQQECKEEPEVAFINDLKEWIPNQQSQFDKMEIIIFLDANEQWTSTSRIRGFASELNLINLNTDGNFGFLPSHPSLTNPAWSTIIDYCLCFTGKVLKRDKMTSVVQVYFESFYPSIK